MNKENKGTDIDVIDFGPVNDTTKNIIKVVGVGGGGCNAVGNMFREGMNSATFAVCNTDSKSLSINPVPTKIMLGNSGLGAGADPAKGRAEAEKNIEDLKKLFSDNTKMAFVTAAMGGGTGTGAGPLVAKVARDMGLLTIGIVTIPFYFERKRKIVKALQGLDEMRANVDALLIINNEQISKVYSDSHISVKEALRLADTVMGNAVRSICELITLPGTIQTDFSDVTTTLRNGGGAIMAIGRASGPNRVQDAILNALNSPLLYGNDISKATRILFNIYTSHNHELYVDEIQDIDAFMDALDSNIDVIWGMASDDTLDEDAKITILATGFDNSLPAIARKASTTDDYDEIIDNLYGKREPRKQRNPFIQNNQGIAEETQTSEDSDNNNQATTNGVEITDDTTFDQIAAENNDKGQEVAPETITINLTNLEEENTPVMEDNVLDFSKKDSIVQKQEGDEEAKAEIDKPSVEESVSSVASDKAQKESTATEESTYDNTDTVATESKPDGSGHAPQRPVKVTDPSKSFFNKVLHNIGKRLKEGFDQAMKADEEY